jgi:hypothetical protein
MTRLIATTDPGNGNKGEIEQQRRLESPSNVNALSKTVAGSVRWVTVPAIRCANR